MNQNTQLSFARNLTCVGSLCLALLLPVTAHAQEGAGAAASSQQPDYAYGHAVAVLEETNNQGSAYFSLAVGNNGKVYVGPAKYGVNAYLVEIDPKTDEQRIVIDTHKLCGIENATGFKAQSKIHTRPFVAPSGTIYVGSKQGYPDKKAGENPWSYPGGYIMSYDPQTDTAKCIAQLPYRNYGVADVVADEDRRLLYFVAQEDNFRQHMWGKFDQSSEQFTIFGPPMALYAATLLDKQGQAYGLTRDYQLAMYNPETDEIIVRPLFSGDQRWDPTDGGKDPHRVPTWQIDNDGRYAYLIMMKEPMLYRIDLHQPGDKIQIEPLGATVQTDKGTDSRSSLDIGPDGRVYALVKAASPKAHERHPLHHLTRYDPRTGQFADLGIIAVRNKDYVNPVGPDGKKKPFHHGLVTLSDGTLTFIHVNQGLAVGPEGTVYSMQLSPLTVMKYEEK